MKQLLPFLIAIISMAAMVCLTGATANNNFPVGWYIVLMFVITIILQLVGRFIEKNFVDGEWIDRSNKEKDPAGRTANGPKTK